MECQLYEDNEFKLKRVVITIGNVQYHPLDLHQVKSYEIINCCNRRHSVNSYSKQTRYELSMYIVVLPGVSENGCVLCIRSFWREQKWHAVIIYLAKYFSHAE